MIRINNVYINYEQNGETIEAVKGVSLDVNTNDYVALIGPSGSGKSSLIAAIAGLIDPLDGDIFIEKFRISKLSRSKKARVRAKNFGIIFQFSEMINRFTVEENLLMAYTASHGHGNLENYQTRLEYLCGKLDIYNLLGTFPSKLSGGQLQKTAIARALIKDAPIILADEPSGDLDPESIHRVKLLLREEHERGKGIFLVTHDMKLAFDAKTIFELRAGKISALLKQT